MGRPALVREGHDEKYLARDPFGNEYRLRLKNALPLYVEVAASIVSEAAGLPNLPVFPVLVRRGEKGIPTAAEAAALDPGSKVLGLSGANGEYVPATLQSAAEVGTAPARRQWTSEHAAQFLGQLSILYLFGSRDTSVEDILFINDHFAAVDLTHGFKFYPEETGSVLEQYAAAFPDRSELGRLNPILFVENLNRFVTRIESLEPAALDALLLPYFRAVLALRKHKQEPAFDYRGEFFRRIGGLRADLGAFLRTRGFSKTEVAPFGAAVGDLPRPAVVLPRLPEVTFERVPRLADAPAADLLWAYFFQNFHRARSHAEMTWGGELGVNPPEAVGKLIGIASKDKARLSYVGPHIEPDWRRPENDGLPQLHVNRKNPKTLFVVPTNDEEAREIVRLALAAGAQLLELQLPHGAKLKDRDAQAILKSARKAKCTRVAIVELPGETPAIEESIRAAGLDLFVVDHHTYKDDDRSHKLSSLEQSALILGWKLSPTSRAVGVLDGNFIFGLADLGVPREKIQHLINPNIVAEVEKVKPIDTPRGKVFLLRNGRHPIGDIGKAAAALTYPEIPNVLTLNSLEPVAGRGHAEVPADLRFTGRAEFVKVLDRLAAPHRERFKHLFSGGDATRSMFWGAKEGDLEAASSILTAFEKAVSEMGEGRNPVVAPVAAPGAPQVGGVSESALRGQGLARAVPAGKLLQAMRAIVGAIPELEAAAKFGEDRGARVYLFGGAASAVGAAARKTLIEGSLLPTEIEDVFRPDQDVDLVIDGSAEDSRALRFFLDGTHPSKMRDGRSRWEVRALRHHTGPKDPLLLGSGKPFPAFARQNNDSMSTGLLELAGDGDAFDLRQGIARGAPRNEALSEGTFLGDLAAGRVRYFALDTHDSTPLAASGRNPAVVSALRVLVKAVSYGLEIPAEDFEQLKRIVGGAGSALFRVHDQSGRPLLEAKAAELAGKILGHGASGSAEAARGRALLDFLRADGGKKSLREMLAELGSCRKILGE